MANRDIGDSLPEVHAPSRKAAIMHGLCSSLLSIQLNCSRHAACVWIVPARAYRTLVARKSAAAAPMPIPMLAPALRLPRALLSQFTIIKAIVAIVVVVDACSARTVVVIVERRGEELERSRAGAERLRFGILMLNRFVFDS